jgi:hypothetical protein
MKANNNVRQLSNIIMIYTHWDWLALLSPYLYTCVICPIYPLGERGQVQVRPKKTCPHRSPQVQGIRSPKTRPHGLPKVHAVPKSIMMSNLTMMRAKQTTTMKTKTTKPCPVMAHQAKEAGHYQGETDQCWREADHTKRDQGKLERLLAPRVDRSHCGQCTVTQKT